MLNFTDTLFVGALLGILMLSVAGGDGGRGMRIKDPNIKKCTFITTPPKSTCCNVQPCTIICDCRGT